MRFVERDSMSRTRIVGIDAPEGFLDYGPNTPGPFGEVTGYVGEAKLVLRFAPWGAVEAGRHSLEVHLGDDEYVLVSRGLRARTRLERSDGHLVASLRLGAGTLHKEATPMEAVLVALLIGSGIGDVTRPQSWASRP